MFTGNDVDKNYILMYMNYRNYSNTSESLVLEDFEVITGKRHNGHYTVQIIPTKDANFLPFQLTETYYNDVVLFIASEMRDKKIDKILNNDKR